MSDAWAAGPWQFFLRVANESKQLIFLVLADLNPSVLHIQPASKKTRSAQNSKARARSELRIRGVHVVWFIGAALHVAHSHGTASQYFQSTSGDMTLAIPHGISKVPRG